MGDILGTIGVFLGGGDLGLSRMSQLRLVSLVDLDLLLSLPKVWWRLRGAVSSIKFVFFLCFLLTYCIVWAEKTP